MARIAICNRWWLRSFFSAEKSIVLNYLTLTISDKEINEQFQLTNACMMHSIFWLSFAGFFVLLATQMFNFFFKDG